jgi:galacturonosyltransferase
LKELISKLVKDGHEVIISLPKNEDNKYFIDMGCQNIDISIDRRGINPIKDLGLTLKYIKIIKEV